MGVVKAPVCDAAQRRSGVTRVRKLAAIRKFFTFLEENKILAANPANAVKGARREEKEPNILFKEQYKALLYEALARLYPFDE
jgi:site-specific recombinase XerD